MPQHALPVSRWSIPCLLAGALLGSACNQHVSVHATAPGAGSAFRLIATSVDDGATIKLNQPLELRFDRPLDFATISSASIRIAATDGTPAVGSFAARQIDSDGDGRLDTSDPTWLVFTPRCPLSPLLEDAGWAAGGKLYVVEIRGVEQAGLNVLRARDGTPLGTSVRMFVRTPDSFAPVLARADAVPGPPQPLLRSAGSADPSASHYALGDGRALYPELDSASGTFGLAEDLRLPRNLFSEPTTGVTFVLRLNQSIDPARDNLARLRFEYGSGSGAWIALETR